MHLCASVTCLRSSLQKCAARLGHVLRGVWRTRCRRVQLPPVPHHAALTPRACHVLSRCYFRFAFAVTTNHNIDVGLIGVVFNPCYILCNDYRNKTRLRLLRGHRFFWKKAIIFLVNYILTAFFNFYARRSYNLLWSLRSYNKFY